METSVEDPHDPEDANDAVVAEADVSERDESSVEPDPSRDGDYVPV
jgi:hypothetical protein